MGVLWAVPAYLVGAVGGGLLLYGVSGNQHDRALEASMTGAFLFGPVAAIVGFAAGAFCAKPKSRAGRAAGRSDTER
jgi:hypothetical protein